MHFHLRSPLPASFTCTDYASLVIFWWSLVNLHKRLDSEKIYAFASRLLQLGTGWCLSNSTLLPLQWVLNAAASFVAPLEPRDHCRQYRDYFTGYQWRPAHRQQTVRRHARHSLWSCAGVSHQRGDSSAVQSWPCQSLICCWWIVWHHYVQGIGRLESILLSRLNHCICFCLQISSPQKTHLSKFKSFQRLSRLTQQWQELGRKGAISGKTLSSFPAMLITTICTGSELPKCLSQQQNFILWLTVYMESVSWSYHLNKLLAAKS